MSSTSTAIDLLPYLIPFVTFVWAVVRLVGVYFINRHVKDERLRADLERALDNGLGMLQQVESGAALPLGVSGKGHIMLNVPDRLIPAVTYVLDHAGPAVQHLGLTPDFIAEQIIARAGRREIETNQAITASSATAAVVPPLAPSRPITDPIPETRQEIIDQNVVQAAPAVIVPSSMS
jgi:hypothetical protein